MKKTVKFKTLPPNAIKAFQEDEALNELYKQLQDIYENESPIFVLTLGGEVKASYFEKTIELIATIEQMIVFRKEQILASLI